MKIYRTEVLPGIIALRFKTQYDTCSTFLRLQEFYESPFREIKGKFFTLETYMDRYAKTMGNFTYTSDWGGFNVPGHVVKAFFHVFNGKLLNKEEDLKACLEDLLSSDRKFYVIGHYEKTSKVDWSKESSLHGTLAHETAHGLFYLNEEYRKAALEIVKNMPQKIKDSIFKTLTGTGGYCRGVIKDETQAYFSTGSEEYLTKKFGEGCKLISKKFKKLLLDTVSQIANPQLGSKFDVVVERARKRTPNQTRQRLIEAGILDKSGELTGKYKNLNKT